jgi:hypothetical protein
LCDGRIFRSGVRGWVLHAFEDFEAEQTAQRLLTLPTAWSLSDDQLRVTTDPYFLGMDVTLRSQDDLHIVTVSYKLCVLACERTFHEKTGERKKFPDGSWVEHVPNCSWGETDA